ncbi:MAG: rod shape-determining protein MreC [Gammaproteobacteria bacterium]
MRGPSPGFRFFVYAVLSVTLMVLDKRGGWLEQVRYVLQAAAYPIQVAVSSPSTAWRWMQESTQTRDVLRVENQRLNLRARELEIRTLRYEALARENAELRGLRDALPPVAEKWLVAEVVNVGPNARRQSVPLNRGTRNGVFKAQSVLDDQGLLGQTTHVGPWSAEVILITDPEHAVPVQVARTGLRTIAVGTSVGLALPYLQTNTDIRVGDVMLTSGLGGVFPEGYPVGRVAEVHWEAVQPLAQVRVVPLARIDRAREVMLVWFRETHPAAPTKATGADLLVGDAKTQPQPTPPKPKPVVPAVEPTEAAGNAGASATPAKPATNSATPAKPATTTPAPTRPAAGAPLPKPAASPPAEPPKEGNP